MNSSFVCEREYSIDDIIESLREVGIKEGDSIFVHSDLRFFGKLPIGATREDFLGGFLKALLGAIGNGNLIMPTFTYSFCKDEVFDPDTTPSKVGVLTEYFRKQGGVKRSKDGIFSVAAIGPDKDYFTDVSNDCFGKNSIFEKLYDRDAKIVFLGPRFDITYMHFVEQSYGVPYRWIKMFGGFAYNVGPLDKDFQYDLEGIADSLKFVLKETKLGNSKIRVVGAVDAFDEITEGLKRDINFLLK